MKQVNKKGFTLVEMMLSIAIIILISGLFVSLIVAVKDSWYRVYNSNDSTDYAALYSQALENQILRDCQESHPQGKVLYYIDSGDSVFMRREYGIGDDAMFNLQQMQNKNGDVKWLIFLGDCSYNETTRIFTYTVFVVDNYIHPGRLQSRYTSSFWLPIHNDENGVQTTASIEVGNSTNGAPSGTLVTQDGRTVQSQCVTLYVGSTPDEGGDT